jgi:hypothetical protein
MGAPNPLKEGAALAPPLGGPPVGRINPTYTCAPVKVTGAISRTWGGLKSRSVGKIVAGVQFPAVSNFKYNIYFTYMYTYTYGIAQLLCIHPIDFSALSNFHPLPQLIHSCQILLFARLTSHA